MACCSFPLLLREMGVSDSARELFFPRVLAPSALVLALVCSAKQTRLDHPGTPVRDGFQSVRLQPRPPVRVEVPLAVTSAPS